MEYGLDPSFHIYAGGLGILAGDYLKAAKEYDMPVIGVGIRWRQGYTHQEIGQDLKPYDIFHDYEYDFLKDTGVKVTVQVQNRQVVCKVWKVDAFGNAPLYLLDTYLPENEDSWITGQLYGRMGEERIAQEIVLGIGGVKALKAMGIQPDVYHFNEGHAVLAGFELIRQNMAAGMSFDKALEAARDKIVFTTHTPVIEGNESHPLNQMMYMGANNTLSYEQLYAIGGSPFNMTVAALRLSRISNAVSQLHCQTANNMWKHVSNRSEIIGITNGIHIPTWVDNNMLLAAEGYGDLWECHMINKMKLIRFIKEKTGVILDPDVLLIGFGRRATAYKRHDLIFRDPNIIFPLLRDKKLQIVFSGKAHPLDNVGKEIIANIVKISKQFPESVVFLENYDMNIGRLLTRGADVWLNNPRRPMEACGTSGMKAAMNGVLNLSILDGWWAEACEHGVNGWQFGDGFTHPSPAIQDSHDSKALYQVLLNEVIPTYYHNRQKWIDMMRNSILSTKDRFNIKRMMDEYFSRMYLKNSQTDRSCKKISI
jgi:starch phosphorylase